MDELKYRPAFELEQDIELLLNDRIKAFQRSIGIRGICSLCQQDALLYQDHDHVNGLNRGKLCHGCNLGLGCFKDAPTLLLQAVDYLKKWAAVHFNIPLGERRYHKYKYVKRKGRNL